MKADERLLVFFTQNWYTSENYPMNVMFITLNTSLARSERSAWMYAYRRTVEPLLLEAITSKRQGLPVIYDPFIIEMKIDIITPQLYTEFILRFAGKSRHEKDGLAFPLFYDLNDADPSKKEEFIAQKWLIRVWYQNIPSNCTIVQ